MPGGHSKPLYYDKVVASRNYHRHDWRLDQMQWSPSTPALALDATSSSSSTTTASQSYSWSHISPTQEREPEEPCCENNGVQKTHRDEREVHAEMDVVDGVKEEEKEQLESDQEEIFNQSLNYSNVEDEENDELLDYVPHTPSTTPPPTPPSVPPTPEADDSDLDESQEWKPAKSVSSSKCRNNNTVFPPTSTNRISASSLTSYTACASSHPHFPLTTKQESPSPPPENQQPPRQEAGTIHELMDQLLNGNITQEAAESFERMAGSPPGQPLETPYFSFFPGPRMHPVPTLLYCSYSFLLKSLKIGISFLSQRQQNGSPSTPFSVPSGASSSNARIESDPPQSSVHGFGMVDSTVGVNVNSTSSTPYSRRAIPSSTVTSSTSHTNNNGRENFDFCRPVLFAPPPPLLSPIRDGPINGQHARPSNSTMRFADLEPPVQQQQQRQSHRRWQAGHVPRAVESLQLSSDMATTTEAQRVTTHRGMDATGRKREVDTQNERRYRDRSRSQNMRDGDRSTVNGCLRSSSSHDHERFSYNCQEQHQQRICYRENCGCRFNYRASSLSSSMRWGQNDADDEQQRGLNRREKGNDHKSGYYHRRRR